jgi:hypothetical protein
MVVEGILLWNCAAPGFLDKHVAGSGPANVEVVELPADRRCAVARYGALIGQPIKEIGTAILPRSLRVYPIGGRITMDHRPGRMNLVIGRDGRVVKVRCG